MFWEHILMTWMIFVLFCRDRVSPCGQVGLKLLNSSNQPASATQSAGIIGMSHSTHPQPLQRDWVSPLCCPEWNAGLFTGVIIVHDSLEFLASRDKIFSRPGVQVAMSYDHTLTWATQWDSIFSFLFFFFVTEFCCGYPDWSAMAQSRLTATSTSWVQAIFLP